MEELDSILKFIKLTLDFQKIERAIFVKNEMRNENDVEHSYQLAMVAWYIVSSKKLNLNVDRVIKYGLLHDLVEVYAGDTYIFDADKTVHLTKVQRESDALYQLKEEFMEFPEMIEVIETYEARQDEESKFIYALDKIIPLLNIYLDNGKTWNHHNITLEQIIENKSPKVAVNSDVEKYFNQLLVRLKKDQETLFHKHE